MSHGSGDEENYWPGYVDALTSMVQVLAFVMMLLALAVYVLSQNVSRSAVVAISKAIELKPDANATVEQLLGDALVQIAHLKALAARNGAGDLSRSGDKLGRPDIEAGSGKMAPGASPPAGADATVPKAAEAANSRDKAESGSAAVAGLEDVDARSAETKFGSADAGVAVARVDRPGAVAAKSGDNAGLQEKAGPKEGAAATFEADRGGAVTARTETAGRGTQTAEGSGASAAISRPLVTRHQEPGPSSGKAFVLHFPARSFQLDPAMIDALERFLADNQADSAGSVEVRAYAGAESGALTEARRLAYYRAMTVRKALGDRRILLARIHVYLLDTPEKSLESAAEISLGRVGAN